MPPGGTGGTGGGTTVQSKGFFAVSPSSSVAVTVAVSAPTSAGVPEMFRAASIVTPFGKSAAV